MFCIRCGNEAADNAKFCVMCGAELHTTESLAVNAHPPKRDYSSAAAHEIRNFLNEMEIHYRFDENEGIFVFQISLSDSQIQRIQLFVKVDDILYQMYSVMPIKSGVKDKEQMREVMDFICRVNNAIKIGSFDFDVQDGEIRFKYYDVFEEDGVPRKDTFTRGILLSTKMCERFGDGILAILFKGVNAETAFTGCGM